MFVHRHLLNCRRIVGLAMVLSLFAMSACDRESGHDHARSDHDHAGHDHSGGGHHHGHDHSHSGPNPHIWLDPESMIPVVRELGKQLHLVIEPGKFKPTIAVSIFPVASLVKEIVGDDAHVITLLTPGTSPHGAELTAEQLRQLQNATVLIVVGRGLDPWAQAALKKVEHAHAVVWRLSDWLDSHDAHHGHDHGHGDPASAGHADPPATRTGAIETRLKALSQRHRDALRDVPQRKLVTIHNAFDLLAERYGLEVVEHLMPPDPAPGEQVTPAAMADTIAAIKKHKLQVIYAEPQFPEQSASALREATGVAVLRLDPLGDPNVEGYRTYFELMESNLKALVDGQSRTK